MDLDLVLHKNWSTFSSTLQGTIEELLKTAKEEYKSSASNNNLCKVLEQLQGLTQNKSGFVSGVCYKRAKRLCASIPSDILQDPQKTVEWAKQELNEEAKLQELNVESKDDMKRLLDFYQDLVLESVAAIAIQSVLILFIALSI